MRSSTGKERAFSAKGAARREAGGGSARSVECRACGKRDTRRRVVLRRVTAAVAERTGAPTGPHATNAVEGLDFLLCTKEELQSVEARQRHNEN